MAQATPDPDVVASFDVTCVIGRVDVHEGDGPRPHVAAMQLIAEHDSEGTFTFPMRDGRTCRVTVEWDEPRRD